MSDELVDLSPYWVRLRALAEERYQQKDGFASSRYWNPDSHFVGLCGEVLYALATGERVDTRLLLEGDGGSDFRGGVDVKTCRFSRDAYLKHPVGAKRWPEVFVLCYLDKQQQAGRILGWVQAGVLKDSNEVKDFGHGPQHVLHQTQLRPIVSLNKEVVDGAATG